jgi:hypothetical protein
VTSGKVDLTVWSDKEKVNAIIISSILKSPELLGIPKFHDESLDWAEILKSLLLCLGNYLVNLPACDQRMRILLGEACDDVSKCYT